jgi:hypothetical protein
VRIESFNLFDLRPESFGQFDVVIFPGVLYHLRYPFWALKLVRDVLRDDGVLILETAVLVDDNRHPLMYCPVGSDSPYEATSVTFFNPKGLHDTLRSMGFTISGSECQQNWRLPPNSPIPDRPSVDRCVTVCRKSAAVSDKVNVYWDGTPNAHDIPTWDGKRVRVA